ncbi:hypothetical protein PGTUg99_003387 [Puccinia graminis f. sp. tritici]|uniref:Uncharacterized protein n=1 Tax=Puccinia graminis f. sp. tritici TaxID=56615 RepID=A0A5B0P002_PUCGR|nr:hypothetical protein PGTUg99_003387 [Puccinia graminis f. sp. tritici]
MGGGPVPEFSLFDGIPRALACPLNSTQPNPTPIQAPPAPETPARVASAMPKPPPAGPNPTRRRGRTELNKANDSSAQALLIMFQQSQDRQEAARGLITTRQPPWRKPIRTPGADWCAGLHANLLQGSWACSWRAGLHAQL